MPKNIESESSNAKATDNVDAPPEANAESLFDDSDGGFLREMEDSASDVFKSPADASGVELPEISLSLETEQQNPEEIQERRLTEEERSQIIENLGDSNWQAYRDMDKPEESLGLIVDTADNLVNAKPEQMQEIFSAAVEQFRKNNPSTGGAGAIFTGHLNSALSEHPRNNELQAHFYGSSGVDSEATVAILSDNSQTQRDNPNGILGVAYAGNDSLGRQAFESTGTINGMIENDSENLPEQEHEAFRAGVEQFIQQFREEKGGLESIGDVPPRQRDERTPSLESVAANLKTSYGSSVDAPDQFFNDMASFGHIMAFSETQDMQSIANATVDHVRQHYPGVDAYESARILTSAAGQSAGPDSFEFRPGDKTFNIEDRRLESENSNGIVARIYEGDDPTQRAALQTALRAGNHLTETMNGMTDEEQNQFLNRLDSFRPSVPFINTLSEHITHK